VRVVIAIAVTLIGLAMLAVALDVVTALPAVCTSCHEMDARSEAWQQSAHSVVPCVQCHQPSTRWYQVPTRLADRAVLLSRDMNAHFSGAYAGEAVDGPIEGSTPMTDGICLQCHDPNRKATSGYRIVIDHVEHAKQNGSCVSCHVRTAHPAETRGGPLSLMGQCYTCHGADDYPEAATTCVTCHPADYEPRPESHSAAQWARSHGETWTADGDLCTMCHEQTYCDSCHGIAMPHPARWAQEHGERATAAPETCQKCHDGGPDLCSMCHHTSYEPQKGTWVDQHRLEVRDEGSAYCFECHEPRYCSFCHTKLVEGDGPL
jgi:nitrate/TMAO reductase-like tetraheme cytochrome c subunit